MQRYTVKVEIHLYRPSTESVLRFVVDVEPQIAEGKFNLPARIRMVCGDLIEHQGWKLVDFYQLSPYIAVE